MCGKVHFMSRCCQGCSWIVAGISRRVCTQVGLKSRGQEEGLCLSSIRPGSTQVERQQVGHVAPHALDSPKMSSEAARLADNPVHHIWSASMRGRSGVDPVLGQCGRASPRSRFGCQASRGHTKPPGSTRLADRPASWPATASDPRRAARRRAAARPWPTAPPRTTSATPGRSSSEAEDGGGGVAHKGGRSVGRAGGRAVDIEVEYRKATVPTLRQCKLIVDASRLSDDRWEKACTRSSFVGGRHSLSSLECSTHAGGRAPCSQKAHPPA